MTTLRTWAAVSSATLVILVAAACAGPTTPGTTESATPTPSASIPASSGLRVPLIPLAATPDVEGLCPTDVDAVHAHQSSTEATGAIICTSRLNDSGSEVTTTISRVSDGLEQLLTAYSVADAPVDPAAVCTLQIEDPLLVWVEYPGERNYPIYAPVDVCGFPTGEARAAYEAVTLSVIGEYSTAADGTVTTITPLDDK